MFFKFLLVSVVAGDISRIDTFPLVKRRPIRRIDDVRDFQPQLARTSRQLPFNPFDLFNFIDGGRRRSQSGTTRFIKPRSQTSVSHKVKPVWPIRSKQQSASSKLKLHLTPITARGVLPNFIYLEAEQMPGYETFKKHEIVRNGVTTESPHLVKYFEKIQDYSSLVDERTPSKETE